MVSRQDESKHKLIAQVDPKMCVACGVCIGSCDPLALTLGQQPAEALWDTAVAGFSKTEGQSQKVVFTCERHMMQNLAKISKFRKDGMQVVPVTCVGMIHPRLLAQTWEAGADEVQIIGCPPEDCANREGNLHLQKRLDGDRKPILRSKYAGAPISTDWLAPPDFKSALKSKGHQVRATTYDFVLSKTNWKSFIPALILLAGVFGLQILATSVSYRPTLAEQAGIEVVMNHQAGYPLKDIETGLEPSPNPALGMRLFLQVDDEIFLDRIYSPRGRESQEQIFERFQISPGEHHVVLTMFDREDETESQVLLDELVSLIAGQILRLQFEDAHLGSDSAAGERLYNETSLGTNASCRICHSLDPGENLVGPSFYGIATRAAERIPGLSAEEYLRQSILYPDAYVVEGFPSGLMVPNFGDTLTDAQIDDLVAFLMTLK
jgi:mono/diheme cytochrome c family protein/ferredoxin